MILFIPKVKGVFKVELYICLFPTCKMVKKKNNGANLLNRIFQYVDKSFE